MSLHRKPYSCLCDTCVYNILYILPENAIPTLYTRVDISAVGKFARINFLVRKLNYSTLKEQITILSEIYSLYLSESSFVNHKKLTEIMKNNYSRLKEQAIDKNTSLHKVLIILCNKVIG